MQEGRCSWIKLLLRKNLIHNFNRIFRAAFMTVRSEPEKTLSPSLSTGMLSAMFVCLAKVKRTMSSERQLSHSQVPQIYFSALKHVPIDANTAAFLNRADRLWRNSYYCYNLSWQAQSRLNLCEWPFNGWDRSVRGKQWIVNIGHCTSWCLSAKDAILLFSEAQKTIISHA